MSTRMSLFWITLTVVLLACSGCGKGGASPTGEGAPPVTATTSATADTTPAAAAATGTGQAQSGGGGGSGNSGGGGGSGNSGGGGGSGNSGGGGGSGNSGGGGGSGNSGGGGGAQGAPLHIPSIIIQLGEDLQTEYNAVVANVVDQCRGTLCVSVSKAGTGKECGYTETMNGTPVTGDGGIDSQGNQFITVPRGASIVIEGNAFGDPSLPCPSDVPAVTVFAGWFSQGKTIGEPGDGGARDEATRAIAQACPNDNPSCVNLRVAGGPKLCSVESQPGPTPDIQGLTDINVLQGGTITLDGNSDGSSSNCPSDNSSSSGGGGSPGDQSPPSP
jgi:hypothetical protein